MLTRTELMEPSMSTFSFSFLLMMTGCSRSSLLLLREETVLSAGRGQRRDARWCPGSGRT